MSLYFLYLRSYPHYLLLYSLCSFFNFSIQNYFDDQITKAVNNSYGVAKNYLDESKENVKSDVILMSVGLNRASNLFYSNQNRFKKL